MFSTKKQPIFNWQSKDLTYLAFSFRLTLTWSSSFSFSLASWAALSSASAQASCSCVQNRNSFLLLATSVRKCWSHVSSENFDPHQDNNCPSEISFNLGMSFILLILMTRLRDDVGKKTLDCCYKISGISNKISGIDSLSILRQLRSL